MFVPFEQLSRLPPCILLPAIAAVLFIAVILGGSSLNAERN